jgi:peptidoglycan/xylan/chitin deacetylase (PgdA/CDA1 family)
MTARRALTVFILTLISVSSPAAPPVSDGDTPTATVLCYHIVEAPAAPRMHIDRETFRQHLRYLEMTGYNVIPLQHLYEFVTGQRPSIPKNAVVITIDDGWRSTYTEAWPELKKRNFPFTVFVYPDIIGKTANALTWTQIKEMSDDGVDIQSHALTHPFLTKRRHRSMSEDRYAAWLRRELAESRRILEKQTGKAVQFIAYPYGDYDDRVANAAEKAGYTAALTCDFGPVKKGSNPLKMKRFVIDDQMDFADFRGYLGAKPMQIAEMTPQPGKPAAPEMTTIKARIPKADSIDPRSVGMALLSLGTAVPYAYDARTGEISLTLNKELGEMKPRSHRAIVWANDAKTGKRVEATWVFRLPQPEVAAKSKPLPRAQQVIAGAVATPVTPPVSAGAAGGGAHKR